MNIGPLCISSAYLPSPYRSVFVMKMRVKPPKPRSIIDWSAFTDVPYVSQIPTCFEVRSRFLRYTRSRLCSDVSSALRDCTSLSSTRHTTVRRQVTRARACHSTSCRFSMRHLCLGGRYRIGWQTRSAPRMSSLQVCPALPIEVSLSRQLLIRK